MGLTGEPVTASHLAKRKWKADVLREEWAPYDISRYAYEGEFRFRLGDSLDETDEDLDPDITVCVCGSWSGWTKMEPMGRLGAGSYIAAMQLGEGRYEQFYICLNGNRGEKNFNIYPTVNNATERIWIDGPDANRNGRKWLIDGRDEEVPEGTIYQ